MTGESKDGWNEAQLHAWLRGRLAPDGAGRQPGTHDAALLEAHPGAPVLCCDRTEEGVHFEPTAEPRRIGWKAAARAISDLAATAATPRALLLSLGAPSQRSDAWMRAVIEGVIEAAESHGARLVGGDLTQIEGRASLVVSAHGSYEPAIANALPPGRDRAQPGQKILLTGPVGGSLLGRHLAIEPRVIEGLALHAAGATAMMDVSDGLAIDAGRIAMASDVVIELDSIPIHADAHRRSKVTDLGAIHHALYDGEDHELLATLSGEAHARLGAILALPIGRVLEASPDRPAGVYVPASWLTQSNLGGEKHGTNGAADPKWTRLDPLDGRGWIHGS
jgi:thiamine-monophosphate kinase